MDELKNLVIQTLETNGVLGQVRAQLRSCVFKTIDSQDQVEQRRSSFHWENPLARKMREDQQATTAAEIIREFMEFYRLDYSLQVFGPESNLKGAKTENRDELASNAGLSNGKNEKKPLLIQMIESLVSGVGGAVAPSAGLNSKPATIDPLSHISVTSPLSDIKKPETNANVQSKVDKAQSLLDDALAEEKHGFELNSKSNLAGQSQKHDLQNKLNAGQAKLPAKSEKDPFAATDNYDDDFEDDIEEELPAEDEQPPSARHVETSGQGITVSQSLGVDPSVDSLALEDYDHVEPVERLM